jgi:intracellular septation protein A
MKTFISMILFFILTPGILFRISNSKWGVIIHGIIFATLIYFIYNNIEQLTMFSEPTCTAEIATTRKAMKSNVYFKGNTGCKGPFLFESPTLPD